VKSNAEVRSYRDLVVWQKAMDLAVLAYELAGQLPKAELYGLTSQLQRSAVSIAANIAEGHGRETTGDYVRFLAISAGSLTELETHLLLCERLGLLTASDLEPALAVADEVGRMLRSLKRALAEKQGPLAREMDATYSIPRS
jgi:four helix bundle protein